MLNNEFEKQVESAMLLIAQEQIPDTPHRFPPDFEARLIQQTADTGIEQTHMKTAQPQTIRVHKSKSAGLVSRLLTWGSLAAGVMAAVTVGAVMLHEQRGEMQQLSSIPVETVENVSSDRDAAAISTSTPPVESRQHETIAEQAISNILTTESTASPAKTSATAIETQTIPETETVPHNAETTAVVTAMNQEQTAEVNAVGDFDLDGAFTLADGALAHLIFYYELNELTDRYPLSSEQLQQADIIPGDTRGGTDYPLGEQEMNAINAAIRLKYEFGMTGITVMQYLADQTNYDAYIHEHMPKEWENPQIDWSALGLPNPPTESDFLMAFSWDYAIAHSDHELTSDEKRKIEKTCKQKLRQYLEMKKESAGKNTADQKPSEYAQLLGEIIRYTDNLHYQKYGTPGFHNTDLSNSVIPSWEDISAKISEAKNWTYS